MTKYWALRNLEHNHCPNLPVKPGSYLLDAITVVINSNPVLLRKCTLEFTTKTLSEYFISPTEFIGPFRHRYTEEFESAYDLEDWEIYCDKAMISARCQPVASSISADSICGVANNLGF